MGEPIRVLFVDDEGGLRSVVPEMLERADERLRVEATGDPTTVPDRVRAESFDCVVSDYDMPARDGLELVTEIRTFAPTLPFVLYTGKGSEEIASEAISAGVTDYLQKGSGRDHYELLANRVREAVRGYRAGQREALTEERYRRLVEQSVIGISLSQDGVFQYTNQRFNEIFGWAPGELQGKPVTTVIAPDDHDRVEAAITRRESGDVDRVHYVVTGETKRGEQFEVEVSGGRVDYEGGPAVLGVLQPLDARRAVVETAMTRRVQRVREQLRTVLDAEPDAAVRERIETALATLDPSTPDPETTLAARCREAWRDVGLDSAALTVEDEIAVTIDRAPLYELFVKLWAAWRPTEPTATVTPTAGGFAVTVRPTVDADPRGVPPAVGRAVTDLGWTLGCRESDEAVVYEFTRQPTGDGG